MSLYKYRDEMIKLRREKSMTYVDIGKIFGCSYEYARKIIGGGRILIPDDIKEQRRKIWYKNYYIQNKEKLLERSRIYQKRIKENSPEEYRQNYKKYNKEWYEKNRELNAVRCKKWREENKERNYQRIHQYWKDHPDKVKCWGLLNYKKPTKRPCEICGETNVHAHHEDYSKPLEVKWLCPLHHKHLHMGILKI